MYLFIVTTLFAALAFADTPKEENKKSEEKPQKMEEKSVPNTFEIGPYDKQGNYQFFDRAASERREAREEKQEAEGP